MVAQKLLKDQGKSLHYHNRFMALFRDHPGEPVPEKNVCTLWCRGRHTDHPVTPSALSSAYLHHAPIFYRPDALPATQPTALKAIKNQGKKWKSFSFCKSFPLSVLVRDWLGRTSPR